MIWSNVLLAFSPFKLNELKSSNFTSWLQWESCDEFAHRRRSSVNKTFLPENYVPKINEMPEFYVIFARKINEISEFLHDFARKHPDFTW